MNLSYCVWQYRALCLGTYWRSTIDVSGLFFCQFCCHCCTRSQEALHHHRTYSRHHLCMCMNHCVVRLFKLENRLSLIILNSPQYHNKQTRNMYLQDNESIFWHPSRAFARLTTEFIKFSRFFQAWRKCNFTQFIRHFKVIFFSALTFNFWS